MLCNRAMPYKFNIHLVCSFRAALKISCDSHLLIQLLELDMECTETWLERRGNKLEYKENIVKGVGDMSIKNLKAQKVSR